MIVDDCYLIIGSANINDRSLLGSRDSEVAVFIEGPLNQQVFTGFDTMMVNDRIHDFRKRLFEEHFGVDIEYPISNESWHLMYNVAATNTQIYNSVFKVYPSNEYPDFEKLAARNSEFDPVLFSEKIGQIKGHAVLYPYEFLKDDDLITGTNGELALLVVPFYALQ